MGTEIKRVKHRILKYGTIACRPNSSVDFGSAIRANMTWKGVTCKKCLKKRVIKPSRLKVGGV
jgi:hypothetical protein